MTSPTADGKTREWALNICKALNSDLTCENNVDLISFALAQAKSDAIYGLDRKIRREIMSKIEMVLK